MQKVFSADSQAPAPMVKFYLDYLYLEADYEAVVITRQDVLQLTERELKAVITYPEPIVYSGFYRALKGDGLMPIQEEAEPIFTCGPHDGPFTWITLDEILETTPVAL